MPFVDGHIEWDSSIPLDTDASRDPRIVAIQQYMDQNNIEFDGIWTLSEMCVVLTSQIASYFWKKCIHQDVIAQLKNKKSARKWLFKNHSELKIDCSHVCSSRDFRIEDIQKEDFPLIAKGAEGYWKNCVKIVDSFDSLKETLAQNPTISFVVESYFEWTDIDLNLIVQNGRIVWSWFVENFAPRQPWFLENGSQTCVCINEEEQEEVIRYVQNIITLTPWIQSACLHVEFRVAHKGTDFSFTLIEINFRLWGGENFVFHLGQDTHDLILSNLELAFDMPVSQTTRKNGYYKYIKTADLYVNKAGVLRVLEWPKTKDGIMQYVFFAEPGSQYEFPPRWWLVDDIWWIVAGSHTSPEEASIMLEKALQEVIVDIQ